MTHSGHGLLFGEYVSYRAMSSLFTAHQITKHIANWCILFALLSNISLQNSPAQRQYRFEHLSLEEGVAHSLVYCMLQDSKGFIWFGTLYGLVRYDGYTYTTYRYNPDDPNSLSNDDIVSLLEDRLGNLWIGTYGGGLNKLDANTGKMKRYTYDPPREESISQGIVWTICEDHEGILWLGTNGGGMSRLDPRTEKFTRFRHDSTDMNSISEDFILSIVEDSSHNLWIGTGSRGISILNPDRTAFTHISSDPKNPSGLSSNNIKSLYLDKKGELWVCTYGGLNRYRKEDRTFVRFHNTPSDPNSLSFDFVNTIIQDRSGIYWVGTAFGLNRFDATTGIIKRLHHQPSNDESISSDNITALLEDRSGILWVGTYQGGVDKLIPGKGLFTRFRHQSDDSTSISSAMVNAVLEDHSGTLWIGTDTGINKLIDSTSSFFRYPWKRNIPNTLNGKVVSAIAEDQNGNLWIGTRRGLNRLDRERTKFTAYPHDHAKAGGLPDEVVTCLVVSKIHPENLWVGTPSGLQKFNIKNESFTRYPSLEHDSIGIGSAHVLSLCEDRSGALWIGTYSGLFRIGADGNSIRRFTQNPYDPKTLSNNYALSMLEDASGTLWIGTGGGLNSLNREDGTFTHFTRKDGLPNSVICGVVEERPGVLWLSTFRGISKFDTHEKKFTNYDISDGLQGNMFNAGAYFRRSNGGIVFGGINGFNIIDTKNVVRNAFVPPIAITSFMLFDNTERDFISTQPHASSISLSHTENFFALAFAALDYTQPEKNRYAFKLEGFDREWNYSGNRRFARYMNLDPGEYIFKVKGSNNNGVWNETGKELRIVIMPPFWKTWWFYSLSAIAMLSLVVTVYNYRVKEKVRRFTELERVRAAENKRVRKRAADDFHDEFGHKLTKISLLGQVIKRALNGSSPELLEHLNRIIQASNDLSMGMRDFLWTLNPDKDSAYDVAIRLKDFGDELYNGTGIGFRVTGLSKELDRIQVAVDTRRHLTLLFKEAMNNTVKHSECSNVTLGIDMNGQMLDLHLADDGKGFNTENGSHGQGLYSMQARAEKMNGSLTIESNPGTGTKVKFSYFVPEHELKNGSLKE